MVICYIIITGKFNFFTTVNQKLRKKGDKKHVSYAVINHLNCIKGGQLSI